MLWFESRKQLSGGLINAFLSVLVVLQVETARNLYVLWYECRKILKKYILFFNPHGIMNTLGLLQSELTLQETRSIHDSMNRLKIEFIAYIYILLKNI